MARLFERVTKLILYTSTDEHTFEDYDTEFDIFATSESEPNTARITIWGLNAEQRGLFSEDLQFVEFYAGYREDRVGMIFRGSWDPLLSEINHYKDGPDWQTVLETGDGFKEVQNSFFNRSFAAGTPLRQVVTQLAASFGVPLVYDFTREETFLQAATFTGRTSKIMDDLAWSFKFDWSIQFGSLIVTEADEPSTTAGVAQVLNHKTGLLGQPVVNEKGFELKTMMLSTLKPKGLIQIEDPELADKLTLQSARIRKPKVSETFRKSINQKGIYVIDRIQYNGMSRGGEYGCTIGVLFI